MPGNIKEVHKVLEFEKPAVMAAISSFTVSHYSKLFTLYISRPYLKLPLTAIHVDILCAFSCCMHTMSLGGDVMH
jgi:hypothetical protein